MLSGVALVVFGAGLILSNPIAKTLSRPVRRRESGSGRLAGSGSLFEIAGHVTGAQMHTGPQPGQGGISVCLQ